VDARLQRRVQRYGWDKAEAYYERYWARQLETAQSKLLAMAALQPGERVLETACGTGLITFPIAAAVTSTGAVVATDISEKMVEAAVARAAELGVEHVRFERMDAEALAVDDSTFDAALCALGLMYFPEPVQALKEMLRALRPGGQGVSLVWGARNQCGWAEIFPIIDARVQSDVCPLFFQLGTGENQSAAFTQAGFLQVRSERISTMLHYDSPENAIGAAFAGGPVALAYARIDEKARAEAHSEYLASIEPYRSGTGYEIPGEFVVTLGRRGQS
jgi:ubiquinone/menaquinone biosynthesis C-methylase UbiE